MSCERYQDERIDVAAGDPPSAALLAHLEACPECQSLVAEQRRMLEDVDGALRARLGARPSPALAARVAARVRETDARRRWWPAGLAIAAAVAVALVAGWMARRPRAEMPPAPRQAAASPATPRAEDRLRATLPSPRVAVVAPPAVRGPAHASRREPMPPAEPLVLVPPGQVEALWKFMAELRRGRQPEHPVLGAATSVGAAVEATPLEIPSVPVPSPLPDPAVLSERSQR